MAGPFANGPYITNRGHALATTGCPRPCRHQAKGDTIADRLGGHDRWAATRHCGSPRGRKRQADPEEGVRLWKSCVVPY